MDNWIQKELEKFQKLYREYNDSERAICGLAFSMIKVLNGISEMQYTKFHMYQRRIVWEGMQLFSRYCIEQMEKALQCEAVITKNKIINDIEESIQQLFIVYREMIDGTGDTDRRIFQSLPINLDIYEVSPKLCAFYASILNELVGLFEENEKTYAFIPYRSIKSVTETKVLLKRRNESGKVVIVYISDGLFEKIDVVSVCLLHEAFHVITKQRFRKKRFIYFWGQMILYMKQTLFAGVDFGSKANEIKEDLIAFWFKQDQKEVEHYKNGDPEGKRYYSNNTISHVSYLLKDKLVSINKTLDDNIMEVLTEYNPTDSLNDFENIRKKQKEIVLIIRNNIKYIVTNY